MDTISGIEKIPKRLRYLERSLADLVSICDQNNICYLVIGSISTVCALGKLYRVPYDIDVLFDYTKEDVLHQSLLDLGYKKISQDHQINKLLLKPLLRFVKEKKIIEPRGAHFTKNGIEIPFHLPVPLVKENNNFRLKFNKKIFSPKVYKFGNTLFNGIGKEALFLALSKTLKINFGKEIDKIKRTEDLRLLQQSLTAEEKAEVVKDRSGIYYKNIPLLT
ncbi:hypothetical protein HYW42_04860 [Candidatus Daviesbacteria bacterium]|nr:hypothetical protein [Candidatus Daviesbacteria bacterium]